VNEPQVLLADEPTGNLDPQSGLDVFQLFKDINMKGTTVVVATHDWEMVKKLQRRTITMERGTVTDDGRRAPLRPLPPVSPKAENENKQKKRETGP